MKKVIYLAGGCYWGVEKYISSIKGVAETQVGFANGNTEAPTYRQVYSDNTGYAETVKVTYETEDISLKALLRLFYKIIDPVSVNRQGGDVGTRYRTGVYFSLPEDEAAVMASLKELEAQIGEKIAVEGRPLKNFYPAEEYHQKYLDKNPEGYCHVPLKEIMWAKTVNPAEYDY